MALAGGLLNPLLLYSEHDQYRSLFLYLVILDAGLLAVSLARGWLPLAPLALVGTQGLYWLWFSDNYHPEKRSAALLFQSALFALFLAHDAAVPILLRRLARPWQLAGAVLGAFLFALAGYILLDTEPTAFLAFLAVALAIVYACLAAWAQARSPEDQRLQLVVVAVALAFLTIAIALRAEAGWIALGWAVEGLALWWLALRIRASHLQALGAVLLVLAVGRYLPADAPWMAHPRDLPILNAAALSGLAIAACLVVASALVARLVPRPVDVDRVAMWLSGLGGVFLAWVVLSLEVYHFADTRWPIEPGSHVEGLRRAQTSLSLFWAAYAAVVLAVGFRRRLFPLRVLALALFGLTLGKVVLVDMAGLPGIYRIMAFFVLAVAMGAAAWGYQRFEAAHRLAAVEGPIHAPS
jgi:uncharacterized membrane protein